MESGEREKGVEGGRTNKKEQGERDGKWRD